MLGARAIALVRLGRFEEAATAAVKAAARPNAHAHIFAVAAFSLALHGALEEARAHAAGARRILPGYALDHFRQGLPPRSGGRGALRGRGAPGRDGLTLTPPWAGVLDVAQPGQRIA